MVISGIKALVLSLGLVASLRAAEPTAGDDVSAGPSLTLLPLPQNPEAAAGGQEVPPPPVPATGRDLGGGASQVPSAVPLPNATAPAAARGSPTAAPVPAQRSTSPAQEPTRPPEKPATTRAPGDVRPQEIQFDREGLISLHTNELDVRQLLELISRRSGLNILVSPKVSGTITANFEKVTIHELLDSVLKLANLVEKTEGGIHFIYSREELKDQAETTKKERIVTKVYRLNYVRADELMVMIAPFLSEDVGRKRFATSANYQFGISESSTLSTGVAGTAVGGAAGGAGAGGVVAPGGAGTIQRGTQPITGGVSMASNDMVVIQDYESNLKIIDQIIQRLDVQPVQVLIEAVIIQVELDLDTQLGVNFAVVDNLGQQLGTIGTGTAINGNVGFTPAQVLTAAGKIAAGTVADPTGFASATNGIKYGFISNNITGFVRALETVGSTKILASPRILVLNKQRAEIQLGQRLGFKSTTTQNIIGTTQAVQFLNTGTLLRLRPFVSSDDIVRMEIHPERSTGNVDAVSGLPTQTVAELTTNVMVPDGATLVIGGLMEDEDDYTWQGLPGLSRLPILGHLFGTKEKIDQRRELVVLLTPHIWSSGQASGHPDELAMRGTDRSREGIRQTSGMESASRRPPAPARLPAAGIRPTPADTAMPTPPSRPMPTSPLPLQNQDRVPAPMPPVSPPPSTVTGLRTEVIKVSDRTKPADTLESQPRTPLNGLLTSSSSLAEPRALPAAAPIPKVDPMVSQAALETRRVTQPAPAAVPIESRAVPRRHVVRQGENFPSIAQDYYGSPRFAKALWWANRTTVAWPRALVAGTRIIIPPLNQLEPSPVEPRANQPATSDPRVQPVRRNPDAGRTPANRPGDSPDLNSDRMTGGSEAPQADSGYAIHVVQRHETLTSIARDRLGDPRRYGEIARLNRDLLADDDRLAPGMRLLLPPDARPQRGR